MSSEHATGWAVGIIIPRGQFEEMMLELYRMGCKPVDLAPHFELLANASPAPLGLPDHTKKRKKKVRRAPATARPGGLREFLLTLLSKGPLLRSGITKAVKAQRHQDPKQLGTRLWELKKKNLATEENGIYTLTEAGMKQAAESAAPKTNGKASGKAPDDTLPREGSQTALVLKRLQRAHQQGRTVKLTQLYTLFQKQGMRGRSASVALDNLMKKGHALRVGPGEYKFKPASPQAPQEPTNA